MKIKSIFLPILVFFLFILELVLAVCPNDNTYINSNKVLSKEFCSIIDKNRDGVLIVNSSNIILDCGGTTLKGNGSGFGIIISCYRHVKNVTVKNCKLINYMYGIGVCTTRNNKIFNNYISNMSVAGIDLIHQSDYNEIYDNVIESNIEVGVRVYNGTHNRFYKNKIISSNNGIMITGDIGGRCDNNSITENIISDCVNGIFYGGCDDGIISNNNITNSHEYGIFFNAPRETNKISNNYINSSGVLDIYYKDEQDLESYKKFKLLISFVIIVIISILLIYYIKRFKNRSKK